MSKIKNEVFTNKGFTLIELLIVMVILGILVAIVFTNIDVARLTGRGNDTKRVSDLRSIQDGILREQAQGYITLVSGTTSSNVTNSQLVDGSGWVKFNTLPGATPTGYKFSNLPVLPKDPQDGTTVTYVANTANGPKNHTTVARYVLCVDASGGFEINSILANDAAKMATDGGNDETAYEVGTNLSACAAGSKFGTEVSGQ